MFGMIMPLCNRMFCCIFEWYFYIENRLKYEKIFSWPALELFHCLPPLFHCLLLLTTVRLHGKKLYILLYEFIKATVIDKFLYLWRKFVKSWIALMTRNKISAWPCGNLISAWPMMKLSLISWNILNFAVIWQVFFQKIRY